MKNLKILCEKYFQSSNPYDILKVDKTSNGQEIKRAYYRLSLIYHPDKIQDSHSSDSTEIFQVLSKIYTLLTNDESRKTYDQCGELSDDFINLPQDMDWLSYWRSIFKGISKKDIEEAEKNYKGSEDEKGDVIKYYLSSRGSMSAILDSVMCATDSDEDRFRGILEGEIVSRRVPRYRAFARDEKLSQKRKRKADKEAAEAEAMARKMRSAKPADLGDLAQAIQKRQSDRESASDSFMKKLEEKYSKGSSKGKASPKNKSPTLNNAKNKSKSSKK